MRAMALCLGILRAWHRRCTQWDNDVGHRIGLVAGDGLYTGSPSYAPPAVTEAIPPLLYPDPARSLPRPILLIQVAETSSRSPGVALNRSQRTAAPGTLRPTPELISGSMCRE
jgi:hypothetical protein